MGQLNYGVKITLVLILFITVIAVFMTWLVEKHPKFFGPTDSERRIELQQKGFDNRQIDSIIKDQDQLMGAYLNLMG